MKKYFVYLNKLDLSYYYYFRTRRGIHIQVRNSSLEISSAKAYNKRFGSTRHAISEFFPYNLKHLFIHML
jgi:hypothetical protein